MPHENTAIDMSTPASAYGHDANVYHPLLRDLLFFLGSWVRDHTANSVFGQVVWRDAVDAEAYI